MFPLGNPHAGEIEAQNVNRRIRASLQGGSHFAGKRVSPVGTDLIEDSDRRASGNRAENDHRSQIRKDVAVRKIPAHDSFDIVDESAGF